MIETQWSPEKIERLTALFNEGLTYTQIADRIGGTVTRSMISGKLARLDLKRGKPSADEYAERRRARVRAKSARKRERRKQVILTSLRPGTSKTAPIYRRSLPVIAPMTSKREMRAFLAQAMLNTVGAV